MTIDGENRSFGRPLTVAHLLERIRLDGRKVAVEPNHEIVLKSNYAGIGLHEGNKLVVVHFVGGGKSDVALFAVIDEPLVIAYETYSSCLIIGAGK